MNNNKQKKMLLKTDIPRKEGFLYYCKGNPLQIWEVKANRGRPKNSKNKRK